MIDDTNITPALITKISEQRVVGRKEKRAVRFTCSATNCKEPVHAQGWLCEECYKTELMTGL